jgi:hypothetical protein
MNVVDFIAIADLLRLGMLSQEFRPQHLIIFKRLTLFSLIILSMVNEANSK